MRAALRIKTDGGTVVPRQTRQNGSQLNLHMEQAKAAKDGPKDDLSKIHGIGPVFARTLNKMGLHTFVQIARWKTEDIAKVAKKLYTAPERIKRDKWIDEAKKSTIASTASGSSRMLKKSARLSCSFGLFGLSRLIGLFGLSCLFG